MRTRASHSKGSTRQKDLQWEQEPRDCEGSPVITLGEEKAAMDKELESLCQEFVVCKAATHR